VRVEPFDFLQATVLLDLVAILFFAEYGGFLRQIACKTFKVRVLSLKSLGRSTHATAGKRDLVAAAVVDDGERPVTPCGGGRQRLAEFGDDSTEVIIGDDSEVKLVTTLAELLPLRFTSHSLAEHP